MGDIDGIKRKIRSLLEVAKEGSGATDHERSTARSLAQNLMSKHKLDERDVPGRDTASRQRVPAPPPQDEFVIVLPPDFYDNLNIFGTASAFTSGTSGGIGDFLDNYQRMKDGPSWPFKK